MKDLLDEVLEAASQGEAWRLIGALLAEYHEEWSTGRQYLKMDTFSRLKERNNDTSPAEQMNNYEPTEATTANLL